MSEQQRNPILDNADAWAAENGHLLAISYDAFATRGEWPEVEELQHDVEVAGGEIDVYTVAARMPRPLGFVEQQRVVLLVRALIGVPAARPLLDDWYAVLQLAYRRWRADRTAPVTWRDVFVLLDGDAARTRAVSLILDRESWPFSGGQGGPDDDWSRELHSNIRVARSARSADELIAARDALVYPPLPAGLAAPTMDTPVEPETELSASPRTRTGRKIWDLASNNQLIAGLLVLVIGAIGAWAIRTITQNSGRTTTKASGRLHREQSGSGGARTFADPRTLSRTGDDLQPGQYVMVSCKLYSPHPASVVPDGYWYRLASPPYDDKSYAPANSFWNGDLPGRKPYTHNTDRAVPVCLSRRLLTYERRAQHLCRKFWPASELREIVQPIPQ